jgi:nitrate reductase assembly molybdenum cofactor insertion protein NarJ
VLYYVWDEHRQRGQEMFRRQIVYNRDNRAFAMYLDGELVGYAGSFLEAEAVLDQLMLEQLRAAGSERVA